MRTVPGRRAATVVVATLAVLVAASPVGGAPPPPGPGGDPNNPGIVYRTVYSRPGSASVVEFSVACPDDTRPFGGGVDLIGATTQVIVHRAEPVHNATDNAFFVKAVERAYLTGNDYPGTWQVRAMVACGPILPNLTYLRANTFTDSDTTKEASVVCPAGLTRVGMGMSINTSSRAVRVDQLGFDTAPDTMHRSVRVIASELPAGTPAGWSATAAIVCATQPPNLTFGAQVHYSNALSNDSAEPCDWHAEHAFYPTAVGGGTQNDPGQVNLQWYFDDLDSYFGEGTDPRFAKQEHYAESSATEIDEVLSFICMGKV
ncbi:hypothetical protein [Catellatospora vulcania]|uniref:hypothetical protein n=1 Tax=Catellatospora vulcania TaxID=1460450 RepID=UPI0012D448C2|nr:hypothetical protein [Catellatospora vulcania]